MCCMFSSDCNLTHVIILPGTSSYQPSHPHHSLSKFWLFFMGLIKYYLFYEAFCKAKLSNKIFFFFEATESSVYTALKYMSCSPFMMVIFRSNTVGCLLKNHFSYFLAKRIWLEEQCAHPQGMGSNFSKSNMIISLSFMTQSLSLLPSQLEIAIRKKMWPMRLSRTVKCSHFTLLSS